MNWRVADKVAAWKVFRRRMEVIFVADQIPEERQWALILVAGGDEAYNRWDTLEETVQDRKKVEQVWKAFEKSFEQSTSFWHFRDTYLADFRQDESETTADLDLRIKQTVRGCQWQKESEEERMIDLLYHATIYYEIRKFVQESEPNTLTCEMVIEKAKAHERNILEYKDHQASHGGANSAPSYNNPLLSAHALSKRRPSGHGNNGQRCGKCGKSHEWGNCLAYGKTCNRCQGINHFKAVCHSKVAAKTGQSPHRSKKSQPPRRGSTGSYNGQGKGGGNRQHQKKKTPKKPPKQNAYAVTMKNSVPSEVTTTSGGEREKQGNVSSKTVPSGPEEEGTYNRFSCFAVHSKMSQSTNAKSKPTEGLYTDTDPDNRSEIITDVTIRMPGKAGTMMMEVKVDPGAQPSCIPLHKFKTLFPHLCRDGLPKEGLLDNTHNKELDYLIEEEIITEQVEPTPWVSSVTFPRKPNGEVRVCLDPSNLNKAIIREHHKPMMVEEIAHELAGATVYTKADALKAFLQIHLTHEASLLTTFNSHRGRLRFLRMPFGAKMSQDVFQLRMDAILEQCPGVIGIHDDMVIFGADQEDHDANLINLLNVCQKEGLVLNSKKLELQRERVTFFGAEYSAQGMHPDPKKVQGITEMTAPTEKQQLQSFLGMVNYMGTFIPNLSHHTEPLWAMLKKDNMFHWEDQETRSFQQVKTLIAKANTTPLRYYDRDLPVTVQADASLRGLGACLIQKHKGKDQPIAFASKSLTDAETRYANIERELLAIVFACQRFSTYLLGRSFVAESDHKPLEMIAMKNLANAPPRLQRMLLELQRYDVTIKYRPGKEMQLANALSRCPARASQEIKLDMRVDYIAFTKPWIEKLKDSTQRDLILATVYQLTQQGWPHQRRHVPRLARRYWNFRDELSTDDGLLLKGPRLIIPGELQEEYLSRLHEGHLSANKVQENAKQHMYWTGIDADIEDYTKRCQECIKRSQVPKEPLQPHDIPEGPWRKLGIDYFAFDGSSYVLICDYFSKFPFLYRAKTSFWSLRDRLIDLFSIEGYPDEIVSDNGPPFQSKEFAKFLSGLGIIKHTTSSPGYPRSNGFIERYRYV